MAAMELGSVVRTGSFATDDVSVLRLQHPLGTRFRVALPNGSKTAASKASNQDPDCTLICIR